MKDKIIELIQELKKEYKYAIDVEGRVIDFSAVNEIVISISDFNFDDISKSISFYCDDTHIPFNNVFKTDEELLSELSSIISRHIKCLDFSYAEKLFYAYRKYIPENHIDNFRKEREEAEKQEMIRDMHAQIKSCEEKIACLQAELKEIEG